MANGSILMAQELRALVDVTAATLQARPDAPEVVGCDDGALFLTQYTRLLRAGQTPRLCVLDTRLPGLPTLAIALGVRAVERGLGIPPTPILFHTAEPASDELRQLLTRVGRAVHLQRTAELPVEEQGRRLTIAVEKLLVQLGGK